MKFVKIREVKTPTRGTSLSSGIDFYVPNDFMDLYRDKGCIFTPSEYIENQEDLKGDNFIIDGDKPIINIPVGYGVKIPSGIKVLLDEGTDLVFDNKSGVVIKTNLLVGADVIDEDYRGEINIHLINTSKFNIQIEPGQKIVQGIIRKVDRSELIELNEDDYSIVGGKTERGEGGFGSTGTK